MDDFELAVKGLSKYLLELFQKLIEKGKEVSIAETQSIGHNAVIPEIPVNRRTQEELSLIERKIIQVLEGEQAGISLRELAAAIGYQWQTIVRPVTALINEQYIEKDHKIYRLKGSVAQDEVHILPVRKSDNNMEEKPKVIKLTAEEKAAISDRICALIAEHSEGMTLPALGKELGRNWQSLKDIVRDLMVEDKIIKNAETKTYLLKQ